MNLSGLYDMLGHEKDKNELSKFEEYKLKEDIKNNKKLMSKNVDLYGEIEPKIYTCKMYEPCRICDKCLNKASHLYVKCQNCQIPICTHKHKDRVTMIKRANFKLKVSENTINNLKWLSKELGY